MRHAITPSAALPQAQHSPKRDPAKAKQSIRSALELFSNSTNFEFAKTRHFLIPQFGIR